MDSLTQFVLGAAISSACLGRKIGPRKAALVGGLLGTIPDLDVFIPFDDPIDSFVYHRGWTHSIFVHALAAPVFGELLLRLFKGLKDHRLLVYLTVYLCFATHALIDAMTVYGTRLFWPFYPDPVGVGSVFIIDPLYSLPLLAVVIWALFTKDYSKRFYRWTVIVLATTSVYMAASVGIQQHIEARARQVFANAGHVPDHVYAIAAPFNIMLWKVIGLDKDSYQNLYISLFDGEDRPRIYRHARQPELVACLGASEAYQKLEWFSRGYNRVERLGDEIVVSDLRMGLTPGYVFRFAIGEIRDGEFREIEPKRYLDHRNVEEGDFSWLWARFKGNPFVRQAEAQVEAAKPVAIAANNTCRSKVQKTG